MTLPEEELYSIRNVEFLATKLISEPWPKARDGKMYLRRAFRHFPAASELAKIVTAYRKAQRCKHEHAWPMPNHNLYACSECLSVIDGCAFRKAKA